MTAVGAKNESGKMLLKTIFTLLSIALLSCMAILLFQAKYPSDFDQIWLEKFINELPEKVDSSDAVAVGERVMTLGDRGVVSLYSVSEIIKGEKLIYKVMAAYPELDDSIFIAYESSSLSKGHSEPVGKTLIFMNGPLIVGKNLRLLGSRVDEGMIYALPILVDETRALCRQ